MARGGPTLPAQVTPDTRPEELDLNWHECDLPEHLRTKHVHRLHPYLGKFIPQLVEIFLRMYFRPGEAVYDPFVGSGTTLVEANALGVHSIGCDISAFNCLLTRAKTARYDVAQVKREITDILRRSREATSNGSGQLSLFEPSSGDEAPIPEASEYLRSWFAPQALRELLTYRALIPEYENRDLLRIILSRSARSARLTTHFDLDFPKQPTTGPYWCYKHSRMCQPTQEAFKFLRRYSRDTLQRIEEYAALRTDAQVNVLHADARCVRLPMSVDGVITSPPYLGLIDYHEQHRYAYELLGLPDQRQDEIGAASNGVSTQAREAYLTDMIAVFRNVAQQMAPHGRLIVVVADRTNLYPAIAQACDFETEAIVEREVNRRTGRRSGKFYESIFIWRKRSA